jgi:hypothetical protein
MFFVGSFAATLRLAPAAPPAAKPGAPAPKPAAPTKAVSNPKPSPPAAPLAPLAILPSVARVKVTSHGKVISVVQEVNLPRGDWKGEALRFHVAFGAPGPRAIDAHLVGVGDGELEAEDDEAGEVLTTERVPRRPANAHPLLGRDTMAGIVVHLPADALTKALALGNMASLRIRSLVDVTEPDPSGASSIVVRLGASRGTPLTVGRITATAASPAPALARVEARLCGAEADPQPLAVGLFPRPADRHDRQATIAPVLAVRHGTDDLCIRLWNAAPKPP